MHFIFSCIFLFLSEEFVKSSSTQTESIIDLYKKISEKGTLADGLALNEQAQIKLKAINTIRLLPLNAMPINKFIILFNISLNNIKSDEEIKLIEFRLKSKNNISIYRKKLRLVIRENMYKRRRFNPMIISKEESEYLSYDLTNFLFHNSSNQILVIRRQSWIRNYLDHASLVIYSRAPGIFRLPASSNIRTKRSVQQKQVNSPCSRYDLFVNFDQLSFGAWVVEPKRFNAGVCQGDCPNPLSRLFYPTNHAMLLSLLHERGNSIQQPSCVPVRLRPLDLLYYDRRELVIKRHQGMQVEECGCR
ncbi:unnamed protein product [Rotaria magnacalcarata]|uniref:TGF-beta family profile domain-containing protein n=1 Tax=Rotaria magnacalcarata TaxID=392030 RepID=A0A819SPY3_9BILA|nr:unnamed protein product [Rotaria magnacalcarata]CAF2202119.1 unnamed protein product [Rotaria magnacalcarata]CAF2250935.1 unnamed protein product [Rotaria magnacalcarata]CAF3943416.1 unnamed protein product [Rotaria magnacalcarata]CAF4063208.1 unnamed protein product [Rotaria magnacalcarata]